MEVEFSDDQEDSRLDRGQARKAASARNCSLQAHARAVRTVVMRAIKVSRSAAVDVKGLSLPGSGSLANNKPSYTPSRLAQALLVGSSYSISLYFRVPASSPLSIWNFLPL